MDIKTDQITDLLKKQLEKYNNDIDVAEVGEIIEAEIGRDTSELRHDQISYAVFCLKKKKNIKKKKKKTKKN